MKLITPTDVEREYAMALVPLSEEAIYKVKRVEEQTRAMPQTPIRTEHVLHGGMYARTICIPAGVAITGALVKIATTLIVCGHCEFNNGDEIAEIYGYAVIPASAGRKQIFIAHEDTYLTMLFPSNAKTVEEAEAEFTDEAELLQSRNMDNADTVTITGE